MDQYIPSEARARNLLADLDIGYLPTPVEDICIKIGVDY